MRLICKSNSSDTVYIATGESIFIFDDGNERNDRTYNLKSESGAGSPVIAIACSENGKLLFCSYANKWMCCWDISTHALIGTKLANKRPTGLVYGSFPDPRSGTSLEVLLVSDKAGEIWALDVPHMNRLVKLAGHTASVITDMALSPCGTLLATSDRDEKVRISNFPQLANIAAYCLAHTNVVTSVSFLTLHSQSYLVSSGWDHRLCLWNYKDGRLITQTECSHENACKDKDVGGNVVEVVVDVSPAVCDTSGITGDPEPDDEGDDDDDDDVANDVRLYDLDSAGSFPMKVVCSPASGLVVVIFRGLVDARVYRVKRTNDSESSTDFDFALLTTLSLRALPIDALLCHAAGDKAGESRLIVLLPSPHFIQIFKLTESMTVNDTTDTLSFEDLSEGSSVAMRFRAHCTETGCDFSQRVVFSELAPDNDTGMQKHALDRVFQSDAFASMNREKKRPKRPERTKKRILDRQLRSTEA
eukprot:gene4334-8627_t